MLPGLITRGGSMSSIKLLALTLSWPLTVTQKSRQVNVGWQARLLPQEMVVLRAAAAPGTLKHLPCQCWQDFTGQTLSLVALWPLLFDLDCMNEHCSSICPFLHRHNTDFGCKKKHLKESTKQVGKWHAHITSCVHPVYQYTNGSTWHMLHSLSLSLSPSLSYKYMKPVKPAFICILTQKPSYNKCSWLIIPGLR